MAERTPCVKDTNPFPVDKVIASNPSGSENLMVLTDDIYDDFVDDVELNNQPAGQEAFVFEVSAFNAAQVIILNHNFCQQWYN